MGLFKIVREGSWWLRSEQDPRWNCSGSACVGGFVQPQECKDMIKIKTEEFGDPPEDLEWEYMKN